MDKNSPLESITKRLRRKKLKPRTLSAQSVNPMERQYLIGGLLVLAFFSPIRFILPWKNEILSNSQPLTAKPHHKKGDIRKYKKLQYLPNAIIAYFDTTPHISLFFKTSSNNNEGTYNCFEVIQMYVQGMCSHLPLLFDGVLNENIFCLVYFQTLLIFLVAFMVLDVECLNSSTRTQIENQHNQERQRVSSDLLK